MTTTKQKPRFKFVGDIYVEFENFARNRPTWGVLIKALQLKKEGEALYANSKGQGFYVEKIRDVYYITTILNNVATSRESVAAKKFEQNYLWFV